MALIELEQEAYSKKEEVSESRPSEKPRRMCKRKKVQYYVDGEKVTAKMIARVQEDGRYMADFVYGKEGMIEEIHYDKVRQERSEAAKGQQEMN